MTEKKLERIYTIKLSDAYEAVRNKRATKAVKILRAYISRHMKVDLENVIISSGVNSLIWRDSAQKPPRRIKIRTTKEDDKANVWLIGEEEALKVKADAKKKDTKPKDKSDKKAEVKKDAKTSKTQEETKEDAQQKQAQQKKKELEKAITDAQRKV